MTSIKGTRTEANLLAAFAAESQTNRRYLWFAEQADVDGQPEMAGLFRELAESETGHAMGHLEILAELGDPATGQTLHHPEDYLRSSIEAEERDAVELYPSYAQAAREEGFAEIAMWLETVAEAERRHAALLSELLASLTSARPNDEAQAGIAAEPCTDDGEPASRGDRAQ